MVPLDTSNMHALSQAYKMVPPWSVAINSPVYGIEQPSGIIIVQNSMHTHHMVASLLNYFCGSYEGG